MLTVTRSDIATGERGDYHFEFNGDKSGAVFVHSSRAKYPGISIDEITINYRLQGKGSLDVKTEGQFHVVYRDSSKNPCVVGGDNEGKKINSGVLEVLVNQLPKEISGLIPTELR